MKSTLLLAALALTASASPFRGLKKSHKSTDSYEGKHCNTNDFLYKCSDTDPAQMYTCGPAGYQATWKKMPRCTGGTLQRRQ
ncbi:hypothetical protein BC830DRAFT_1234608 [Chytriomyces sp. MP71]|nr:hypothetical protein BC830DRAFT_1234608 [Chytriomyces sp. MP71]